jgi:hypothetical protein
MEKRHWLVRWTTLDGFDDYDLVLATNDEIANIEYRLQAAGFRVELSTEVGSLEYSAELFNQYLDEIEVPR